MSLTVGGAQIFKKYIWETRSEKKTVSLHKMRAEIEAKVSILRKTRYYLSGDKMLEMIN